MSNGSDRTTPNTPTRPDLESPARPSTPAFDAWRANLDDTDMAASFLHDAEDPVSARWQCAAWCDWIPEVEPHGDREGLPAHTVTSDPLERACFSSAAQVAHGHQYGSAGKTDVTLPHFVIRLRQRHNDARPVVMLEHLGVDARDEALTPSTTPLYAWEARELARQLALAAELAEDESVAGRPAEVRR